MQALPETKRLFLREWTMQDLDAWAAILSDAEVMRYYPKPFDRQNVQDWIVWNLENYRTDGFGLWAVHLRATGELLGDCGITMQQIHGQRLPEIGFHMKKSVWGQGYATEAAKACLAWGMQQTDFPAFYCYQKSTNLPSRRVAEKLGMTLQETDTDPMNAFTSMYAIIKRYFLQKHKTPCCNHTAGRCLTNDTIAYRKIYFNKNSIASTYSSGFTSLPLPQTRCSRTKEIMPIEMPSEML